MKRWIAGAAAIPGLMGISLYGLYTRVFRVDRSRIRPTLMKGEQYEARKEQIEGMIAEALALPYEGVETRSHDGLRLFGRFYPGREDAPVEIMFHGYRSHAMRDFAGGLPDGIKDGMNVLVVDQRAHGESEGDALSFGALERQDVLSWIHYVEERFGPEKKILLFGMSMGAATVLMASELDLPPQVCGILADCGYTSAREIICNELKKMHLPVHLFYPLIRASAKLYGGFDPEDANAERALRSSKVPVFLVHGEDDRFVPCEMSRRNYEACASEKELLTVPGAGHGLSYLCDREKYRERMQAFLEKVCS